MPACSLDPTVASVPDTELTSPLPSLDSDETNPASASQRDIDFRHSWWAQDRERICSALHAIFPASKRVGRFRSCGEAAWVYASSSKPGTFKICSDSCRDRWCRSCQRDRSRIIAGNLRKRLEGTKFRLVTLTLRHNNQALRSQLDRLLECFRTLRNKPFWKQSTRGGVAFVELQYNAETDRWHPHLHVICTGDYMSQEVLSAVWYQVTGDSYIVDIRAVGDVSKLAYYVTKYATKPFTTNLYRHRRRLLEAIRSLQGRHLAITFGEFRGWKLTESPDDGDWVCVATLDRIRQRAADGDADAVFILSKVQTNPEHQRSPPIPP